MSVIKNRVTSCILIFLIGSCSLNLISCSTDSEIKAPCNEDGIGCGTKIAINH